MSGSSTKRRAQNSIPTGHKRPRIESSSGRRDAVDETSRIEASSSTAEKAGKICHGCRRIDLECIFCENMRNAKLYRIWGGRRFSLRHMSPQNNCPLCKFFNNARSPPIKETETDPTYELRVFPAKGELGAWRLDFDDSPGFVVLPSSSHYPGSYQDTQGIILELADIPNRLCGRQIQPRVDLSLLKGWLGFCDNNHKALCKKPISQMPQGFRMIDCSTRKIVSWESAVDPKDYIALSYVWGNAEEGYAVSTDSLLGPLPRTIEDSILLTTSLGYRYLWIDRYCIPQDNIAGKQLQIQSMGLVYENAVVTIVAAAGDGPHHGLPGISATPRESQPSVKIGSRTLVFIPYPKKEILNSKWNSRGWTYQEGLLSRRKLIFTDTQVYFQCNAMHCLESIQISLERLHIHKNIRMQDNVDMSRVFPLRGLGKSTNDLEDRLGEYLRRDLTFDSDILDAFRGVLSAFEHKFSTPMKSLHGIPIYSTLFSTTDLEAFVFGLSWWSVGHQEPQRRPGFPSWTWAGWKLSGVSFSFYGATRDPATPSLVDISVEYADGLVLPWSENEDRILANDRSGSPPSFLRICGPTFEVQVSPDGEILRDDEAGILEQQISRRMAGSIQDATRRYPYSAHRAKANDDGTFSLTFLVLGHAGYSISFLVLCQPEGCLHFERFDSSMLVKRTVELGVKAELAIPDALKGLTMREVRIG
ncbi:tol protein [Colletotrichum truncatum]|uniref:Tol protein n=1 Tax=Colletotrichum truncatum TaxID=5467 RepID=A0ACC3ZBK2_COLTU|nr:tol protein [Colletotrichum truncatum]KAF6787839.1 tol protein [Colletotrichum truncatum]